MAKTPLTVALQSLRGGGSHCCKRVVQLQGPFHLKQDDDHVLRQIVLLAAHTVLCLKCVHNWSRRDGNYLWACTRAAFVGIHTNTHRHFSLKSYSLTLHASYTMSNASIEIEL